MIEVHKYLDMTAKQFVGKTDFELWEMLTDNLRFMIAIEYLAEKLDKAVNELGEKVGSAVIAVMATKGGTSGTTTS